jgi:putative heme-binding domain-containing protein
MKRLLTVAALLLLVNSALVLGQRGQKPPTAPIAPADLRSETLPPKNPHLGNKESIRNGMTLYRWRCGECHGLDATGYRGPDLTAALAAGMPDERLFRVIRQGVPGTEMPASNMPDDELLQLMAYLRNMNAVAPSDTPVGNVEHGQQLFAANCTSCHRVSGKGGKIGPELTRIGSSRSRAALVREIRTPSEWIPPNYETVTVVTKDGQKVRGVKKNEDAFSIQVMDMRERLQGYLRSNVQDVVYEKASLMPAYTPQRLSDADLNDLIGYLTTLRATTDVAVQ